MSSQKGVVKFLSKSKGFGFIYLAAAMAKSEKMRTREDELFFHVTGITQDSHGEVQEVNTGDEVEFDVAEGDRGQIAMNIIRTKAAFEKNKTVLPATNVMIGLKKTHVCVLSGILKDIVSTKENIENFKKEEIEVLEDFYKTLLNAESRMNHSGPTKTVVSKNSSEKSKDNGKKTTPATA